MTLAICLRCGEKKFGALNDCPLCGTPPSGDSELDILFSDHRMSPEDLDHFARVIRRIKEVTSSFPDAFRVFMVHLGIHYPELVTLDLSAEEFREVGTVLDSLNLEVRELELRSPRERGNLGARPLRTGIVLSILFVVHVAWALSLDSVGVSPLFDVRLLVIGSLAMFIGIAALSQFAAAWRSWRARRSSP